MASTSTPSSSLSPSKFVRYRPVVSVLNRKSAENSYSWDAFLEKVLVKRDRQTDPPNEPRCKTSVVPVEAFYQAPFAEYMMHINTNIKLEVALKGDYDYDSEPLRLYWFAKVMKIAGYRLLLRYEGMNQPEDHKYDFWVNIGSADVRPVGYCAKNPSTRALVPPELIHDRQSDWPEYIMCHIHACRTIAINWPEVQKGHQLELLDSTMSTRVRPAVIEKIIGTRILVRVNQKHLRQSSSDDVTENDLQFAEGVWMDQDSPLIFPVGWAQTVGYDIVANEEYLKHAREIADAVRSNSSTVPYGQHDADTSLFKTYIKTEAKNDYPEWEEGMKLEVLDPLDTCKELRVATVMKILDDGYLKIGFDGEDMQEDPVPLHCTSDLLFPVGYAEKYGLNLKGPKETSDFEWKKYLVQCEAYAAPEELFHSFSDDVLNNFKIGAKLEATDMCEPYLICAATIESHHGRVLRIKYDGWDSSFDQLFDYRSPNIFPLGWCEMHSYKLEAPKISHIKRKKKQNEVHN